MAPTRSLNVVIAGNAKPLGVASKQADKHMDGVGKGAARMGKAVKAGFAVGAVGAGALIVGLKKSADAAIEAEKSQARMTTQLKAAGISYKAHSKQIDDVIQKHSKLAGLDDEDLQDAFTNIVRVTGDVDKSLRLTGLAADFARAKHMDVAKAGELVGKVAGGNVGILSRYGVSIDKNASSSEALALLQEKFSGQAEAYGKTTAGSMDRAKVAAENLGEVVGAKFAPLIATGADAFAGLIEDVSSGEGVLGGFLHALGEVPGKIADQFNKIKDDPRGPGAAIGSMIVAGIDGIDWRSLGEKVSKGFNSALKIGGKVGSAIVDAFQQVPWGKVGDAIGKGVESSLNFADTLPAKISAGISEAVSKVNGRQVLGKLIDIVGEAIDALFSPSFWQEHWKGILATVTLAIPFAKLLKIPGANTLFKFISKPVFEAVAWMGKGLLSLLGKAASEAGVRFLVELEKVAPRLAGVMLKLVTASGRGLLRLPGRLTAIAADAAEAVAKRLGGATGMIVGKMTGWVVSGVAALGRRVGQFATSGSAIGRSIVGGILVGLGRLGHEIFDKLKSALGWVADKAKGLASGIGKALGIGDGIGNNMSLPSGAGLGGGSLQGAKSIMSPFASIAGRFGLSIGPRGGLRPGAITSSGHPSFHGTGNAIDESGTPEGMMGYFRYLKARFGSRLRELIYTPGGVGIKDGKPFQYTGKVAADHFDHVHVAYTGGAGDGVGRKRGTGDGLGDRKLIQSAASSGGIDPSLLWGVWGAESGFSHGPGPTSPAGATGPFQFMPATAKSMGVNASNLRSAAYGAAKYLGKYKGRGTAGMLAAYNAGPAGNPNNAETQKYIPSVLSFAKQWSAPGGSSGGSSGGSGGGTSGAAGAFAKSQTAAGKAHGAEVKSQTSLIGPGQAGGTYSGALDVLGLGRAESAGDTQKTIKLVFEEMVVKRQRLEKVKKALKRRLSGETRSRLTQEAAQLVADLKALSELMYDLTGGKGGMNADGVVGGTPEAAAERAAAGAGDVAEGPSAGDFVDAAIAEAALTPGMEDDIAAAGGAVGFWEGELGAARASGDPRRVTAAASGLKGARDSLKALTDNTESNNGLAEAIKGLQAAQDRSNDIAEKIGGSSGHQAETYLADLLSGRVVRGVIGRSFTPGSGVEVAYMYSAI